MTGASRRIATEGTKFFTVWSLWVLPLVAIGLTWVLTYLAGRSEVLATGGDLAGATAANNPEMIADHLAPPAYQGFDMMNIGLILMIAVGAVYAGNEYGNGLIRSSLIADPRRLALFATKAGFLAGVVGITGFAAMTGGTILRQFALGDAGLPPFALPALVWRNIGGVMLTWIVLAVLAFAIAMLARNAVVGLVATIPLSVGLGDFLITLAPAAKILPPAAGASLYSEPDGIHLEPTAGMLVMFLWAVAAATAAGLVFRRRDV